MCVYHPRFPYPGPLRSAATGSRKPSKSSSTEKKLAIRLGLSLMALRLMRCFVYIACLARLAQHPLLVELGPGPQVGRPGEVALQLLHIDELAGTGLNEDLERGGFQDLVLLCLESRSNSSYPQGRGSPKSPLLYSILYLCDKHLTSDVELSLHLMSRELDVRSGWTSGVRFS